MVHKEGFAVTTGNGMEQVEVYHLSAAEAGSKDAAGWYYGFGQPGCLFDSEPEGPYTTAKQAYEAARFIAEELPAWSTLKRRWSV